ncbi:hypothetical protein [Gelidibacter sp. F63206]|uniref:hypothetical protein n=1 Tax=Gelidibacter sp. F63206 TaxID=2926425 RepID=UPI001FF3AB85|nr:hypothetical protein [Gelidibacter sp. F63206]MCK0114384.1 hypothetical protein [Gelidibacter sp. F63206]
MNSKFNTKFLSMIILIGLFSGTTFSQENVILKLSDREQTLAHGATVSQRNATVTTDVPYDLLYDLKPTVYVKNNGVLNIEGVGAPVVLNFLDAQSFNYVTTRNSLYNKIELITINLNSENDLRNSFDVAAIRGFSHLKYIYLKCEFPISENQIRSFLQNADPEIIFFYSSYKRS